MAWTRKLPSGRWQGYYRDRNGTIWTATYDGTRGTFRRQSDAKAAAEEQESRLRRGEWIDPTRASITVAERAEQWLRTKTKLRSSSRARLEGILTNHVLARFGDYRLDSVTHAEVQEWVSSLSPATAHKAYDALSQLMRAAVANREIVYNPCQTVGLPRAVNAEQRFLSTDEVGLLADCIDTRFRALVLLAAYGGLRFGELAGLRRARVDLLRGRVHVRETLVEVNGQLSLGEPKTTRSRRDVPLPRTIMREIEVHLQRFTETENNAPVFTGPKGALLCRAGFRRCWWLPATSAAGLDGLRFHDLRHSFVSIWRDAGADVLDISRRAGHSSVAFTLDRYGHLYQDRSDDLADRLDQLLLGGKGEHRGVARVR
ncbi:MAG: tyrosine-type recombinase/integrase [Actinomycetota bacterium]